MEKEKSLLEQTLDDNVTYNREYPKSIRSGMQFMERLIYQDNTREHTYCQAEKAQEVLMAGHQIFRREICGQYIHKGTNWLCPDGEDKLYLCEHHLDEFSWAFREIAGDNE